MGKGSALCGAACLVLGLLIGRWTARPPVPRLIVDPEVPDVAMTFPADREIHVNPSVLALLPPELGSFLLLHEQAHLVLGHDGHTRGETRRAQELAADCWAARRATPTERLLAVRFFEGLGVLASPTHPSGTQRAAEVVRCSP